MSFDRITDFFPGFMPPLHSGSDSHGENHGFINGDDIADQRSRVPSDPHMLGNNDLVDPPMLPAPRGDNSFVALPMRHIHDLDNMVGFPPNARMLNDVFMGAPMPHAPTRIELSPADIRWEAGGNMNFNIDDSGSGSDSDSDSDRTVSDWELDEEFVGLNYNDDSDVEENTTSGLQGPRTITRMDGSGSAPGDAGTINDIDIATLAPNAPTDLRTYRESVGEILTHDSWRRVLAGIPPGIPLPGEEHRGHDAEPVFHRAVHSEDRRVNSLRQAQPEAEDDSTAASSQADSDAEDDIYGATPPPAAALEDPNDSDFDYGRAQAEDDGYQSLEDFGPDDEDCQLAGIPPPKEDSEDDDFMPGNKRAPQRKARGMVTSAYARKQAKKSLGLAQSGAVSASTASRQSFQVPRPKAPVATHATNASQGLGPTKQPAALVNNVPSHEASDEEDIAPESVGGHAKLLQRAVAELRGEVTLAEARYEEAANNPRALTDPRTKKRRMAKLEEIRENLRKTLEKQARFEQRHNLGGNQHQGAVEGLVSTGSATIASSSTTTSAPTMPSRTQVLKQEVNMWHGTIQDLRRKVAHCQAQLADVEAHPEKFTNRRVGFKQGRMTRLENAQHSLSHNLRMLEDKRRLLKEERKRVQEVASSNAQDEQHMLEPDQQANAPAADQSQSMALQASSHQKRKASEMDDDEEEEVIQAGAKRRLMPGTPA